MESEEGLVAAMTISTATLHRIKFYLNFPSYILVYKISSYAHKWRARNLSMFFSKQLII